MGSAAKRYRKRTDRLSRLPESVLYHIMSFLETKSAVRTSALSRRWRSAWKHVPAIDIRGVGGPFGYYEYDNVKRCVDNVLTLRYPLNFSKLVLIDKVWVPEDHLFGKVIRYALSHDVQHLAINMPYSMEWARTQLPFSRMFGSLSVCNVQTLKLKTLALDVGFQSCAFPVVTKLELVSCKVLLNEGEVIDPFSKFPCLENLSVRELFAGDNRDKVFRISGLNLVSLDFLDSEFHSVEIDAPNVKSFALEDPKGLLEFSELTLPSLDHADIEIYSRTNRQEEDDVECKKRRVVSLFNRLSNATSLLLRSDTVKVLRKILEFLEEQPSPFTRLKLLTAEAPAAPFALMNYLLKGSSDMKPIVRLTRIGHFAYWRSLKSNVLLDE